MAKVVTDNQYYTAIANAIRALTGSSNTYTPAQMAPAIIGYIAGGIDLSDVESYFITDVINAMNYVKELGTDDWIHHIVITDTHHKMNYKHAVPIIKAMQDTGYFSKLIHLGDMADSDAEGAFAECVDQYGQFNGDMLFAIGNHDVVVANWQTVFYDEFLSNDTDIVVDASDITHYNYYWDDAEHQIRYIVYHYNEGTHGGHTYALNKMKTAPSGYSVITFCHYPSQINDSILVPLLGHEIDYIGNFAGHNHIDAHNVLYNGMYNQVYFNLDGYVNNWSDQPIQAQYPKVDETNQSQAFTIMSINKSTRNVKFYRIGVATLLGQNWQYTYVKGGSVESWITGYIWGTGTPTSSANGYISTKKYPLSDGNNSLQYYFYSSSGTPTKLYILGMKDGEWVSPSRQMPNVSAVWNNIGGWNATKFTKNEDSYLVSATIGSLSSTDDIVVTTERPTIGRSLSSSLWETGYYLNSSAANVTNETSATTLGFDVLPSTTYRFYVDNASYTGSGYMYAFLYNATIDTAATSTFKLNRRVGSATAGTTEITFTTNANEYYARISVQGLADLTDFASYCHLEVVTNS